MTRIDGAGEGALDVHERRRGLWWCDRGTMVCVDALGDDGFDWGGTRNGEGRRVMSLRLVGGR